MFSDFPIFPEVASTIAGRVDALYFFITAVGTFFFILICVLVLIFAIKYRRRSEDERPEPVHGSLKLELIWTVIPLILALVMFGWGAKLYVDMLDPPKEALNIYVVGKQWMWKIQHPEGNREINELHVPVGTPVKLIMTSEDVIHSFYVPAFRMKMDVLPGRYTSTWFEATKPGKYHLFCAEYCGTKHSQMIGSVYVMEPMDYQDWLSQTAGMTASMAEAGAELFAQLGCGTCHAADSGARGPDLTNLYGSTVELVTGETTIADDDYIRRSILEPTAEITQGYAPLMPTYKGQVDEEGLLKLIAYLQSLPLESSHQADSTEATKGPLERNE
jgi:cytochrome c oxidase subunit 2